VPLDVTKRFPLPERAFDYVFSEHIIEHVSYLDGVSMLRECLRVLTPGGRIRIATPDLAVLIGLYARERTEMQERYLRWICDHHLSGIGKCEPSMVINNAFRNWGHQFIYDYATIVDVLSDTGFSEVELCRVGDSKDAALRGIESHGKAIGDEEMNRFETLVVEARRP
jgi:predicted SAM-dependent methyltransferase